MRRIRRALLSVSDKTGLEPLARALVEHGCELVASGGTGEALAGWGLPVTGVGELTSRPEAFGGRMKTLSFEIGAALLFDRERDAAEAEALGVRAIDLVVCDVMLPGVTGGAVAKTIGGRYPGLPVLFVSGHSHETQWSNGSVPMNVPVLQKPIEELRLTSEVARLLLEKEGGTAGTARA